MILFLFSFPHFLNVKNSFINTNSLHWIQFNRKGKILALVKWSTIFQRRFSTLPPQGGAQTWKCGDTCTGTDNRNSNHNMYMWPVNILIRCSVSSSAMIRRVIVLFYQLAGKKKEKEKRQMKMKKELSVLSRF